MEDLAGYVVISGFFVVAFGSIALCGIAGAALVGVIPTVRAHGPALRREWLLWAVVAAMGSTFVTVLLWGLLGAADDGPHHHHVDVDHHDDHHHPDHHHDHGPIGASGPLRGGTSRPARRSCPRGRGRPR